MALEGGYEGVRRSYDVGSLDESDVAADPVAQVRRWLDEAVAASVPEPTAMTVATVADGRVRSRVVLLRMLTAEGFTFFTNYDSDKGRELDAHPQCAAQLVWLDMHRQVRIEGRAERVPAAESDAYFAGRPRGAQIGAWASPQSSVLSGRADLEASVAAATELFAERVTVPRPPNWGGYRIVPDSVELWQGRADRLHDRLRYRLDVDAEERSWRLERLAP